MNLQKTGTIIYNARKKLNLTQNELGSILGVTGKAVSKWEKGYSFPDVGLLAPLSETLSVPVIPSFPVNSTTFRRKNPRAISSQFLPRNRKEENASPLR